MLVNGRTNVLVKSSELFAITLLNTNGDPVVSVGDTNLFSRDLLAGSEFWSDRYVSFVLPVEGASVVEGGATNPTVVIPSFTPMTNGLRGGDRNFRRPDAPPDGPPPGEGFGSVPTNGSPTNFAGGEFGNQPPHDGMVPPPDNGGGNRRGPMRGRPPWMRWMSEADFKALVATHELHGLVLAMSTDNYRAVCVHDLWLRLVIIFFAGISAAGAGLAARNLSKTADLQIRLVRASELNSHLKELNLAAAGLAHETRNPLNIIRGLAQMLSKQTDAPPDIREKTRVIVDETDKVTSQLTEFINYSRPREVRRSKVALNSAVTKSCARSTTTLRKRNSASNPAANRSPSRPTNSCCGRCCSICSSTPFRPWTKAGRSRLRRSARTPPKPRWKSATTAPACRPKTGRKSSSPISPRTRKAPASAWPSCQQIVLAHGWEIQCLGNPPKGAVFRITHLKYSVPQV